MTAAAYRVACQTSTCRQAATVLCCYPVTRNGRPSRCNRHVCSRCASAERFCPPHARAGADSLVSICPACYCSSCAHGELPCPAPGKPKRVTVTQWKHLLSFGVL